MKRHFAALAAVAVLGIGWLSLTGRADDPAVGPALAPPGYVPPPPAPDGPPPSPQGFGPSAGAPADNPAAGNAQGPEVQTRGPVHEAFAEPFSYDPKPSVVIPAKPPEPINEAPPEMKPDGDNVAWIPGYWAWDDDRHDFLWVSGLWRKMPPGRRWVPGYWVDQDAGSRWVAGMWVRADTQQLEYLPPPPKSLESGPNVAAPSDNHIWMPGSWMYVSGDYRWRPGFWSPAQDNWIWIPPRYIWTPRGAIFVPGYWDYQIVDRGMLFAPVYIAPYVYRRPGFFYSPSVAVSLGGFSANLFVGLNFGHYYFGDFYGDNYYRRGFYPWFDFHLHHGYDPLLNYYSWHYRRQGVDYLAQLRTRHDEFILHADLRPPRTYAAQLQLQVRLGGRADVSLMVSPMRELALARDSHVHLVGVTEVQRREIERSRVEMRDVAIDRARGTGGAMHLPSSGGNFAAGRRQESTLPASGQHQPPLGSRYPADTSHSHDSRYDKHRPGDPDFSGRSGGWSR